MKTTLKTVALATAPLAAALLLTPGLALAQSGAAAGAVPNSFDAPAQTRGQAQGQTQTVRPGSAASDAQAPDVARSQEALRGVREDVDRMLEAHDMQSGEQREILETFRMFVDDRGKMHTGLMLE